MIVTQFYFGLAYIDNVLKYCHAVDRAYRLCGYRLFTSWIYGRLGAHRRRAIPACVVAKIRESFPDDNAVYTGFMESDHNSAWPW